MAEQMSFDDGKYTVINDNGILTALRHGKAWQDLSGNNLVYSMLIKALALQAEVARLPRITEEAAAQPVYQIRIGVRREMTIADSFWEDTTKTEYALWPSEKRVVFVQAGETP